MLKLTGLTKRFATDEVETTALNGIDLEINDGEFVAVMGPSGCGKSTLLNVVGMLDTPDGGSYQFGSEEIANYNENQRAELRKQNLGFIFQSFNLIDELTVHENVDLALLYQGVPAKERKQRVTEVLERMNIAHRAKHFPQQLSGGQQQRVAIARALVGKPKLVLADEPTGNLDSKHGQEVMGMITDLNKNGTTVLMVTHSEEHAQYAHRVVHMLDGQVISQSADAVKEAV
ncbi:ABC transporter ATP-binding protein [Porticoccus sp. W117]|uniref:ABC transporter ATP-binding protein n=1 Tax=Porticoccus sp. W117 TaxID=3054777 RepID=UPI002592008A|nr:ABC transporter ATP-binding protein [Porticoccus sp. W117]MDM3872460.1 ABC transporter ATP-binding protein [Porticoccus sp. W117]